MSDMQQQHLGRAIARISRPLSVLLWMLVVFFLLAISSGVFLGIRESQKEQATKVVAGQPVQPRGTVARTSH